MQGGIHRLAGQVFRPSRIALEPRVMFDGAGTTTLASVGVGGAAADDHSYTPVISANGRYVVFQSAASNLVPGDTNACADIFVRDMVTGTTTRVSVASDGTEANGHSHNPSVSSDGRYIAFSSDATNLDGGDGNGVRDVFLHDTVTGSTSLVSIDSLGGLGNFGSDGPSISADGRYVAFHSLATTLSLSETNGVNDIFIRDTQMGLTTRVSVASDGSEANNESMYASISSDGRYVAFISSASNLVAGDTNATFDAFVKDIQTGLVTRVSVASDGTEGNGSVSVSNPDISISADGRYVVYTSNATNMVADDNNGTADVFVYDLVTSTTTRVSVASDGAEANAVSVNPSISSDGRSVAFISSADNLVPGLAGNQPRAFVHDNVTGETIMVSVSSAGVADDSAPNTVSISANGEYVVFDSQGTNLVGNDINGMTDVFRHRFAAAQVPSPAVHVPAAGDNFPAPPPTFFDRPTSQFSESLALPEISSTIGVWGDDNRADISSTMRPDGAVREAVSQHLNTAIEAMNRDGVPLSEQRMLMQRLGSDAIVDGLAASTDPFSRVAGSLLAQVRDGQHVEMAEVKRALLQAGADPNTVMSYLLAYFEVEKAARTEALSAALGEIVRNPAVADAFAKVNAVTIKEIALSSPRVALLIGVADYTNPLARLSTPVADVTALKDVLSSRFGYQTFTLIDPTKQDIVDWIASLGSRLKEDGSLVIYYAGHGYQVDSTGVGYWLPADASAKTAANWISTRDLSDYLAQAKAKQVMVISDSCYSGSLTKESRLTSDAVGVSRDQIFSRKAVMAMSSGGEEPVRDDGYDGHSVFAGNLLKALSESKSDDLGFVLFNEVRAGVTKDVPQVPTYGAIPSAGHEGGTDFVLGGRR